MIVSRMVVDRSICSHDERDRRDDLFTIRRGTDGHFVLAIMQTVMRTTPLVSMSMAKLEELLVILFAKKTEDNACLGLKKKMRPVSCCRLREEEEEASFILPMEGGGRLRRWGRSKEKLFEEF